MNDTPLAIPSRPLLLLDVDGVLNALADSGDPSFWKDWELGEATAAGRGFPILWSPTVVRTIQGWVDDGIAEVRWLTTWRREANQSLRQLLGFPKAFIVLGPEGTLPRSRTILNLASHAGLTGQAGRDALTGGWWKSDEVLTLLEKDPQRPILWIDDDLRGERSLQAILANLSTSLLLAPPSNVGLTPKLLAQAEAWLRDHQPAEVTP